MKKNLIKALLLLLSILMIAAGLRMVWAKKSEAALEQQSPEPSAEASPAAETPAPAALAETPAPHAHDYDPMSGSCRGCGACCPHEVFSESGRCLACGWACPHEQHDPESARCLICCVQRWHQFGAAGHCRCGLEAPLTETVLPEEFFTPAEHEGRCLQETLTDTSGREHRIAIWLPWDYREDIRYNVVLLLHGDGGTCDDWTDKEEPSSRGPVQMCRVYDRMAELHLCAPFLVVGLNTQGMGDDPAYGERLIEELVLPHLASSYSTYMEGDSHEQIEAAREHIAIGGLSRGSIYTYYIAMPRCLDVAANFCCFSVGYGGTLVRDLNSEELLPLEIRCYVAEEGMRDVAEYNRDHRYLYDDLCARVERINDGENARYLRIDEGHNFLMWTAAIYNALLLMF